VVLTRSAIARTSMAAEQEWCDQPSAVENNRFNNALDPIHFCVAVRGVHNRQRRVCRTAGPGQPAMSNTAGQNVTTIDCRCWQLARCDSGAIAVRPPRGIRLRHLLSTPAASVSCVRHTRAPCSGRGGARVAQIRRL
jgi:hypothetical protein